MRKILLLLFVFQLLAVSAQGIVENRSNWFAYIGQYRFDAHWGFHLESQFRLDGELRFSRQNLFRIGAIYYPSKSSQFAVGYGLINTLNPSLNAYFSEDRIWEQYQHTHKWLSGKNTMINRIRLEQRFVDQIGLVEEEVRRLKTNYQNRIRLMSRHLFNVQQFNEKKNELYFVLQDEVFLVPEDNPVNAHFVDQNRFFTGLGLNTGSSAKMEIGYLNQYINPASGADMMFHAVSLSFFHNLSLAN